MQQIQLPNFPTQLKDDEEVRDFDLGNGLYARVQMTLARETLNGAIHFVLYAQAFQMDADGHFVAFAGGGPSRTSETPHTINASAYNKAIKLDDAWVQVMEDFNPMYPGDVIVQELPPTDPAPYETRVWVTSESKLYRYSQGFADIVAAAKVKDLLDLIEASPLHSGVGFRNLRQNQGV